MSIRCFFGSHELGGVVARNGRLAVRCSRCDRISPGIAIDGIPPTVTAPLAIEPVVHRSPIWWLRAVYEREA